MTGPGIRALCDIYERLPSMFEYRMACGPPVNLFKALQLVVVSVESTFLEPYTTRIVVPVALSRESSMNVGNERDNDVNT